MDFYVKKTILFSIRSPYRLTMSKIDERPLILTFGFSIGGLSGIMSMYSSSYVEHVWDTSNTAVQSWCVPQKFDPIKALHLH